MLAASVIDSILAGLRASSGLEIVAVICGLAYLLLAVRRIRWCWVFGGISSAIAIYLAGRAQLPMQAALQVYYLGLSVYGFWHWTQESAQEAPPAVSTWPLRYHLIACIAIVAISALTAKWLAAETQAAWPFMDSFTTWGSLFTAWLVARMKLENWLYWIIVDSVLAWLFAVQGLFFLALMSVLYVGIVIGGFFKWRRLYRAQTQPA